ncbi:50S ribosomal protein L18 [Patescibacteria group bacterium]|nr:50S ribosomal protein L18 [Patescibacteria group bacterium]MBU1867870.1 50S ribosomal protein L18 [Patescibacteria group bacterium]
MQKTKAFLKHRAKQRTKRQRRVRAKMHGTIAKPRFSAFRSNQHIYAQLIDDDKGYTLATASDSHLDEKQRSKKTKTEIAFLVGQLLAENAKLQKVKLVIFDRGAYKYHGRIKALADGAREGGLIF